MERTGEVRAGPASPVPHEAQATDWFGVAAPVEEAERLASFYDLVYEGVQGDVEWCRRLARDAGGPILELGCGTGRVAVPLARDGHHVVGLERSPAMLDRARERARAAGVPLELREGDVRDFAFDETFSLVLILLNTFLTLEPDERWACLARAREHLSAAGRLVIHVFQPDPEKIVGADGAARQEGSFDLGEGRRVNVFSSSRATIERTNATWWFDESGPEGVVRRYERAATLHYLYRREAELLFSAAGYEIEAIHGDYDGSPADDRSPRLLIVARRRQRGAAERRR